MPRPTGSGRTCCSRAWCWRTGRAARHGAGVEGGIGCDAPAVLDAGQAPPEHGRPDAGGDHPQAPADRARFARRRVPDAGTLHRWPADLGQGGPCGLSERKVEYLRDLAAHFTNRRIDQARLRRLSDEQVIEQLTDIRGIGRWTAEMFLIFNLQRPDVLPLDDLGLVKAVGRHYLPEHEPASLLRGEGRQQVVDLASRWVPFRSVATWYLWRSLDPIPVDY